MLIIEKDIGFGNELKTADAYFTSPDEFRKEVGDTYDLVRFLQGKFSSSPGLHVPFHTWVIDLSCDLEEIFNNVSKYSRREIRKIMNNNMVSCHVIRQPTDEQMTALAAHYLKFREDKGLDDPKYFADLCLSTLRMLARENALVITYGGVEEDKYRCYHAYVFDGKRARQQYSCSLFRNTDAKERRLTSDVHRLLTWFNISYFKQIGAVLYDFAGTASDLKGTPNTFKESFGGKLICEYNFYHAFSVRGQEALKTKKNLTLTQVCFCSLCIAREISNIARP